MAKIKLKVESINTLKNSYVGNPRYEITGVDEDGERWVGKTETNGALAYRITSRMEGNTYVFTYHTTRNGNIVFTDFDRSVSDSLRHRMRRDSIRYRDSTVKRTKTYVVRARSEKDALMKVKRLYK